MKFRIGVALLAWGLAAASARAITNDWVNTAGGDFSTAGNWSPASVPGVGDHVRFTNAGTYTITFGQSVTNDRAWFNATGGVITLSLGSRYWSLTNSFNVSYGQTNRPEVVLDGGALTTRSFAVSISNGSWGAVTLQGVTGEVSDASGFNVGWRGGTGSVVLADSRTSLRTFGGGTHTIGEGAGSEGSVSLIGGFLGMTGTVQFGKSGGFGLLNIAGGTNLYSGALYLGRDAGSRGILTMTGPGAYLSAGLNMGDTAGALSEAYISNGMVFARGETKLAVYGESLLMLAGGSYTNDSGNTYLPHYTGTGIVVLASPQSTFYLGGSMTIGHLDTGRGDIHVSNGTFTVVSLTLGRTGASVGSMYLYNGTAVVRNTSANPFVLADSASTTGLVVLADERALLSTPANNMVVGWSGDAQLIVSNGTVDVKGMTIASQPGSRGRVVVEDGTLLVPTNTLVVGGSSTGILIMAGANTYLECADTGANSARLLVGSATNGQGFVYFSNGTARLRQLLVAEAGYGYAEVGAASITVYNNMYIPNALAAGKGTGVLVMAHADSFLSVTQATTIVGSGQAGNFGASGTLTVSNGTLWLANTEIGSVSDGSMYIGAATVTVFGAGGNALKIGQNSGTGRVTLSHSGSLLEMPAGELWAGGQNSFGEGSLIVSNGQVLAASLHVGRGSGKRGLVEIHNGSMVLLTNAFIGNNANTTSLVVLAHANSLLSVSNGGVNVGVYTNSLAQLMLSNGTVVARSLDVASSSLGGTQMVAELLIFNATNRLLETGSSANAMNIGGRLGATGTVVLAHSGARIEATSGGRLYIGNSGDGRLIISNGVVEVAGQLTAGDSQPGQAEITVRSGRLSVGDRLTLGRFSTGTLVLAHADALVEVGSGGLWMGDANGSAPGGRSIVYLSNGTMRSTASAVDHLIGGAASGTGVATRATIAVSGGLLDFANGSLFIGNRTRMEGELLISGGTVVVSRIRVPAGDANQAATGTVQLSGGVLRLGALESAGKNAGVGARSNLWFSGGTLSSTQDFVTTLNIELTDSPGPGRVTFELDHVVHFNGVLGGPGAFDKTGSGMMVLSNANNFAGGARVMGGILSVLHSTASGSGAGSVAVLSGGTLAGTGSVARYSLGGGTASPGFTTNHVGRMTVGDVFWTNGVYQWDVQNFASTNWDTQIGTGVLTIATGIVTVQVVSLSANGVPGPAALYDSSQTYTALIATAASISGFDPAKFSIDISRFVNDEGATWAITNVSTNIFLVVTPSPGGSRTMYWDNNTASANAQGGHGVWGETSNTWMAGGVGTLNEVWDNTRRDRMFFPSAGAGPWTVRVDIAVATNGGMILNNATTHHYVLDGTGVLSMAGISQYVGVEPSGGSLQIRTPWRVNDAPLTKVGSGWLRLAGPSLENTNGILVTQGRLEVGNADTSGELGGGVITLGEGGPELYFNRSSYTITNPIVGGRTYITNSGGYAWAASATQDFVVIRRSTVVTQEVGSLMFTNYVRVEAGSSADAPTLELRGGLLTTRQIDIGWSGNATARLIVAHAGELSAQSLFVGANSDNDKGAEMFLSNGTVYVSSQFTIGKTSATRTNSFTMDGGTFTITAGSYLLISNGVWRQTGGLMDILSVPGASAANTLGGPISFEGGVYNQRGAALYVGASRATRWGDTIRMLITNDARVIIAESYTNAPRTTFLAVGFNANNTGELVVAGGELLMTNNLGIYAGNGGVNASNHGDIVIAHGASSRGTMIVQGGTVRTYQVWFGGNNFQAVSGGNFGSTAPTGIRADLFMSGGELYSLRGFTNWHGSGSQTNIVLSGGTIGALGDWHTGIRLSMTNSPGSGVTRFDPNGFRMTLGSAIDGLGGLSMDGAGLLVISNNNSQLSGVSYASNGFLQVGNTAGLALGTNEVRVTAAGALGGFGFVNRVFAYDGGILAPGVETNIGVLTAGATTWSNTSYRWEVLDFGGAYGTGWDRYSCTGVLTIASGSINTIRVTSLSAAGSFGAALNYNSTTTYTQLIANAASISGFTPGAFVVDTSAFLNDVVVGSVEIVGGTNLAVVLAPGSLGSNRLLYWDADKDAAGLQNGSGPWNNALPNWRTTNGINVAWNNSREDHAVFGGASGVGAWTVTVTGFPSATAVGLSFLDNGGAFTLDGTGYISFAASSVVTANAPATVNTRLEGIGFSKVGPATLTLGGSNRFTGAVWISNGAVRITHEVALGTNSGATFVSAGAELMSAVAGSRTNLEPLNITGAGTNGAGALRFTAGSPVLAGTVTVSGAATRIGVESGLNATISGVMTGGVVDVFVGGAGRLLVNGGVQLGAGGKLVKDGTGVLSMRGPSTYSSGTIISQGTVRVCGSCAADVMGVGTILMESNTVLGSETAASTIVNPLSIWGNVQLIDANAPFNKDLNVTGAVDLNGATRTITVPSSVATLAGPVSNGGVIKRGSGTLGLAGANTYAGPTIVSNGALIANATNGNSTVTTAGGTTLLGAGSIGAVTLSGQVDPGPAASSVGALSVASMTLRTSSSIRVTITNATGGAGAGYDTINCAGTLTINATPGSGACVIIPDSLGKTPTGFNNANSYSWKIVDSGSLSGYEASKFSISTASFSPDLGGGFFVVTAIGNDLHLLFLPATASNLKLLVDASPSPVGLSNTVTYTLTVTNLSQATASPAMVVSNYLDSHSTYLSSSAGGSHLGGGVVVWSLSSLGGGGSTTLTVSARADYYGYLTNSAHVSTPFPEDIEDDNWATNVTLVECIANLSPVISAIGAKSVEANTPLAFSFTAFDSGCFPPDLSATGLPVGATFSSSNNYPVTPNSYGNFSWTPTPAQAGTHPVRFIASDADGNSTSVVIRIYVAGVGEPTNSAGIPLSQTNWVVVITNLTMSGGSDARVVWTSTNGITYDVFTSVGEFGKGAVSWTKVVSAQEAAGNMSTAEVTAAETRRYFKVVLENEGVRDSNGVWAIFRPSIAPGFNLMSVPLHFTNTSFAGDLGSVLGSVLSGDNSAPGDGVGDEALYLDSDGVTYQRLYLDGGNPGVWRNSGGTPSTYTLTPGQGFFILRNAGTTVQPTFVAPVGNFRTKTNLLVEGFNLMGLSEGWYNITFPSAFSNLASGTLNASWDEDAADLLIQLNANGSYSRFWRAPDGWRNAQTDALATTNAFQPGRAYYFRRLPGTGELRPRF
ncbi:MAG TPA: autotransporter-associated beta strand repeat-containing protein [Kiritimatiellia bacterium]|nr:autotransporter-associated beta strand repeat-containing protein [Kiritimatiellia bacterium]